MLKYILFDLDNTLYSSRLGLQDNVQNRLKAFCADFLGVSPDEAWREREACQDRYSTCLEWLMGEKGFTDAEAYFAAAHPEEEVNALRRDDYLRGFLSDIQTPKAILTNSPREHAERVLARLEVAEYFTHVFDIRMCGFVGKPKREVFEHALGVLDVQPKEVLFIDDLPANVEGFAGMGGKALLFDECGVHANCGVAKIQDLRDILRYVGRPAAQPERALRVAAREKLPEG